MLIETVSFLKRLAVLIKRLSILFLQLIHPILDFFDDSMLALEHPVKTHNPQ